MRQVLDSARALYYAFFGTPSESQPMPKTAERKKTQAHPALEFDLERVQQSVESAKKKRITIPHGLTIEEMQEFILKNR